MARRRSRSYVVPEARLGMQYFKAEIMRKEGYTTNPESPDNVKYQVAERIGVPLHQGYNGDIQAAEAGKVGGRIGGAMVKEMVRMAKNSIANQTRR